MITPEPESAESRAAYLAEPSQWSDGRTPSPRAPLAPLRILGTGSRVHNDQAMIETQLRWAVDTYGQPGQRIIVVQGKAHGADTRIRRAALALGYDVEDHPADWKTHGKRAGFVRNAEMAALGADVCLAFPVGPSPGTRMMIALAEKAGIPVHITEGDG